MPKKYASTKEKLGFPLNPFSNDWLDFTRSKHHLMPCKHPEAQYIDTSGKHDLTNNNKLLFLTLTTRENPL